MVYPKGYRSAKGQKASGSNFNREKDSCRAEKCCPVKEYNHINGSNPEIKEGRF